MTDPDSKPKTLKDLKKEVPSEEEVLSRLASTWTKNDYESVLVTASLLEHVLSQAILSRFVPLTPVQTNGMFSDGGNGPASSFSAKIKIAHALGFLSDEGKSEVERIKEIRNTFAHHKDALSFKDSGISSECQKLFSSVFDKESKAQLFAETKCSDAKFRFVTSCVYYTTSLIGQLRAFAGGYSTPYAIKPEDRSQESP